MQLWGQIVTSSAHLCDPQCTCSAGLLDSWHGLGSKPILRVQYRAIFLAMLGAPETLNPAGFGGRMKTRTRRHRGLQVACFRTCSSSCRTCSRRWQALDRWVQRAGPA
jgi:hypothetical protein